MAPTVAGVAAVGVFSVVFNVPRWMTKEVVREPVDNGTRFRYKVVLNELGKNLMFKLVYSDVLYYILMFVLPLILLIVFNSRLIIVYRRFRLKRVALRGLSGSNIGYSQSQHSEVWVRSSDVPVLKIISVSVQFKYFSHFSIIFTRAAKRRITQTTPRDSPGNLVY